MAKRVPNNMFGSMQAFRLVSVRFALALSFFALAGCSQVPDAANPVEWYKGVGGWFGDDEENAEAGPSVLDPTLAREERALADESFPNLGDVPDRPPAYDPETAAEITDGLVADRDRAQYSDETLRYQADEDRSFSMRPLPPRRTASKEAPPPSAAPRQPVALAGELSAPRSIAKSSPEPLGAEVPGIRTLSPPPPPVLSKVAGLPSPVAAPRPIVPTPPVAAWSAPTVAPPPAVAEALRIPASDIVSSLPYFPTGAPQLNQAMNQNFAQSGALALPANFQPPPPPSSADAAFPSPPVAASGAVPPALGEAVPAPKALLTERTSDGDGPRALSEFDPGATGLSIRVATIHFNVGSSSLDEKDREILKDVVGMFRQNGAAIRIIGHASSRTRDLDPMEHQLANFNISVDRANAVAKELMRQGVDPKQVFIGASSDSEPLYFEVMPAGEAGNRRTEIYIDY